MWAVRADPQPRAVGRLLDLVARTGLPHCLRLRPGASSALAGLAAARGMIPLRELPLMVLADRAAAGRVGRPPGLVVRWLGPLQARQHASVAAAGFEAPP